MYILFDSFLNIEMVQVDGIFPFNSLRPSDAYMRQ